MVLLWYNIVFTSFFQTPFQRLVKRMTRFNSKFDAETTLKHIRSVLDKRRYQFKIANSKMVRILFYNVYFVKLVTVNLLARNNVRNEKT